METAVAKSASFRAKHLESGSLFKPRRPPPVRNSDFRGGPLVDGLLKLKQKAELGNFLAQSKQDFWKHIRNNTCPRNNYSYRIDLLNL